MCANDRQSVVRNWNEIGEALNIHESDMDLVNNLLLLHNTKNGKDRIVPINQSIKSCLLWYLENSPA